MTRPNAEDLAEMPEINFDTCRVVRRGPGSHRRVTLSLLRASQDLTQAELAKRGKLTQSEVSKVERRSDCLVSTAKRYAKALGGTLEMIVVIDGRRYPIALK